jgi:RNA polymerase subunit RPABC4/transcription elongation factor Spt4
MSDEWHYSHKNDSGHDVNAQGYDKNGTYWGTAPFKSYDENQASNRKKESNVAGVGSLIGLIIIIFIIIKVLGFIKKYWVPIVVILSTVILFVIICLIIKKNGKTLYLPEKIKDDSSNKRCRRCTKMFSGSYSACPHCGSTQYEDANNPANVSPTVPIRTVSGETWICKKCNEKNPITSSSCRGCGAYK